MSRPDTLGDRCKAWEAMTTDGRFSPELPLYVRLDGRAFSKFTVGLEKPFDVRLSNVLTQTFIQLMSTFGFQTGYRQSDEMNFLWVRQSDETQMPFGGKLFKLTSVLPSYATAVFLQRLQATNISAMSERLPCFDARVFNLPDNAAVVDTFLWREEDATRNAVQGLARKHFSHEELQGKATGEQLLMLWEAGIDITTHSPAYRRGVWAFRRLRNPLEVAQRYEVVTPEMPLLRDVANRANVLLWGEEPQRFERKP